MKVSRRLSSEAVIWIHNLGLRIQIRKKYLRIRNMFASEAFPRLLEFS
jgi:hypothetical protein